MSGTCTGGERYESATVMALTMGGYLSSANQTSRGPKREKLRHSNKLSTCRRPGTLKPSLKVHRDMLLKAQSGQMFNEVPTHVLGSPIKGVQKPAVPVRSIHGFL